MATNLTVRVLVNTVSDIVEPLPIVQLEESAQISYTFGPGTYTAPVGEMAGQPGEGQRPLLLSGDLTCDHSNDMRRSYGMTEKTAIDM